MSETLVLIARILGRGIELVKDIFLVIRRIEPSQEKQWKNINASNVDCNTFGTLVHACAIC